MVFNSQLESQFCNMGKNISNKELNKKTICIKKFEDLYI